MNGQRVQIKLFGSLRAKAGSAIQQASGATIRALLQDLCEGNEPLRDAILDGDGLRPHVRVMVNGRDCQLADGLETAVSTQDAVAIFPPLTGG